MNELHVVEDNGKQFLFEGPKDMTSAILLAQKGRLIAFRLNKNHGFSTMTGVKGISWQKVAGLNRLPVNVDEETWRKVLATQLSNYRDDGFRGEIRIKIDLGDSRLKRDSKGYYVDRSRECGQCGAAIAGRQYLNVKNSVVVSTKNFEPNDEAVRRPRSGSKQLLCVRCAGIVQSPRLTRRDLPDIMSDLQTRYEGDKSEFAHGVTYTLMCLYQAMAKGAK